jgi:hypothetical protein
MGLERERERNSTSGWSGATPYLTNPNGTKSGMSEKQTDGETDATTQEQKRKK